MNLVKQYIIQTIIAASNNLRLSSEKIEVVAILRERLGKCSSIETEIVAMKKVTSLSKFAVKLDEIYRFISSSKIDFMKITDQFKEHSHSLIRELNNVLDVVTPQNLRTIYDDISEKSLPKKPTTQSVKPASVDEIKIHRPQAEFPKSEPSYTEKIVLGDMQESDELDFEDFEKTVLKPVKDLDNFFKKLESLSYTGEELKKFHEIMLMNTKLSEKVGFDIIANMHRIITKSLSMITENELTPIRETVEGMRACLIVIVAVVRQKDIDITSYLTKAEKFGKSIDAGKGRF